MPASAPDRENPPTYSSAPDQGNPPTYAEALYSGPKMEVTMPNIPMEPSPNGQKPAPKRGWFPMLINGHEMIVMTKEDGVKAVEGLNAGIRKERWEREKERMKEEKEAEERARLGFKAYDAKVRWRSERERKAEAKARKAERAYANAEALVERWNRFWGVKNA